MFISTGDQQFLMISMLMNWRVTRGRTLFKAHSLAPHEARARPRFTVRNEFSVENKDEHERRKTSKIRSSCSCSLHGKHWPKRFRKVSSPYNINI
jgi:hypothetical protein